MREHLYNCGPTRSMAPHRPVFSTFSYAPLSEVQRPHDPSCPSSSVGWAKSCTAILLSEHICCLWESFVSNKNCIEIGPITFICIGRIRQISQNKSVACYQLDKLTWVYTDELKGRLEAGGSDFQVKRFRWQQLPNFVPYK